MVLYAGCHFRRHQIPARFLKEFEHGVVLEGGRVREVDNHLGILQCVRQALAGEGVDAGFRGSGNDLMPFLAQALCSLRTDQAGSADDHDFHERLHLRGPIRCASLDR